MYVDEMVENYEFTHVSIVESKPCNLIINLNLKDYSCFIVGWSMNQEGIWIMRKQESGRVL